MRKLYPIILTTLVLASCTTDSFTGAEVEEPVVPATPEPVALVFDGYGANAAAGTRATGSGAATLLDGAFRVYAMCDGSQVVIDNYQVRWLSAPSVSPTATAGWEYYGYMSKAEHPAMQDIKFWNESAARYDFVAFAGLADGERIINVNENTFAVDASNMYKLYYANRVSAKPEHELAQPGITPEFVPYGTTIKFIFRRAMARIRLGFYETIPGYSVQDLRFYYGDNATATMGTSTKTSAGLQGVFPSKGDYTITYDNDNVAHATFAADGTTVASHAFGNLAYADGLLGTTSATVTYALAEEVIDGVTVSDSPWHPLLPFENNATALTLKVDYTLVANDGTGEEIHVRGAQAIVPVEYCQWRPNSSYTYIFKITTSTGYTGTGDDPAGLYPITFDAEVSEVQDATHYEIEIKK